jgi:6-pyruvoyltetrahydropterin/6-carboxytetrahydropterin synthase
MQREILERYEHSNLNTLEEFQKQVPTTENLCMEIFGRLSRGFQHAQVEKVRMEETLMNAFEYAGDQELRH